MAEQKLSHLREPEIALEQAKRKIVDIGKKQGVLADEEVNNVLSDFDIEPEKTNEIHDYLEKQGIEVMNKSENDPEIQNIDEEIDPNAYSAPLGVKIDD